MAFVLSSLSGNLISAASAGFAPTNSADVSAIASAYQVVSATATQLNAGTAYLTSVNETPISASRAGNAANASLANSAWYDGTGRLISSLPDEATVSGIASAYAESAASSKLDESATADFYPTSNPSGFITGVDLSDYATTAYVDSSISSFVDSAYVESQVSGKQDTLSFDYDDDKISAINGSALAGQGGGELVTAIGTSENGITSINNSGLVDTAALRSADYSSLYVQEPLYISASGDSSYIGISGGAAGIDSATCSAIASSYAESAASSKLDASASSDFYSTSNPSGFITGIDLSNYATTAYVDSSISSFVDSAYVESQVSGKQDTLSFDYDDDKISAINGSALAGQGGGGGGESIHFYGNYWDSATSATVVITADVASVGSVAYQKYNGNYVNTYSGITDTLGLIHLGVASFISPGTEINGKNNGGIPYTMSFAPASSMWTTAGAATGIFAPLQYGTGAGMFMDSNYFKGYLKGNEWFVTDNRYGYVRGEVHNSRGCRVIAEHTAGAGAVLSAKNNSANVTLNSTAYGTAQMAVANSKAYVQVQRGDSAFKYNSAKLDTDYLKFYAGMTTGYLDPEDTASGTSYLPAETEYIYISSIPYWNGKVDSAEMSAYVAKSAYDDLYSAFTALSGVISTYSGWFGELSSISAKVDNSAIGVIE